jgi:hypothetical protein
MKHEHFYNRPIKYSKKQCTLIEVWVEDVWTSHKWDPNAKFLKLGRRHGAYTL